MVVIGPWMMSPFYVEHVSFRFYFGNLNEISVVSLVSLLDNNMVNGEGISRRTTPNVRLRIFYKRKESSMHSLKSKYSWKYGACLCRKYQLCRRHVWCHQPIILQVTHALIRVYKSHLLKWSLKPYMTTSLTERPWTAFTSMITF